MDSYSKNFGLIIAYLLPGFIGLAGLVPLVPAVGQWLQPENQGDLGFGPPVYALLAAITIGMIVSCIRWVIIDHIHQWTGIVPTKWDDEVLVERLDAFNYLVDVHYRYYQFYANTVVALAIAYGVNRFNGSLPLLGFGTDSGVIFLCAVLFAGSRDSLAKYYLRTGRLVGEIAEKGSLGASMTNGNHHGQEAGAGKSGKAGTKPEIKNVASGKSEDAKTKGDVQVK